MEIEIVKWGTGNVSITPTNALDINSDTHTVTIEE